MYNPAFAAPDLMSFAVVMNSGLWLSGSASNREWWCLSVVSKRWTNGCVKGVTRDSVVSRLARAVWTSAHDAADPCAAQQVLRVRQQDTTAIAPMEAGADTVARRPSQVVVEAD